MHRSAERAFKTLKLMVDAFLCLVKSMDLKDYNLFALPGTEFIKFGHSVIIKEREL